MLEVTKVNPMVEVVGLAFSLWFYHLMLWCMYVRMLLPYRRCCVVVPCSMLLVVLQGYVPPSMTFLLRWCFLKLSKVH
jgi:hypothetical protein